MYGSWFPSNGINYWERNLNFHLIIIQLNFSQTTESWVVCVNIIVWLSDLWITVVISMGNINYWELITMCYYILYNCLLNLLFHLHNKRKEIEFHSLSNDKRNTE